MAGSYEVGSYVQSVTLVDYYAYLTTADKGIEIVDISEPSQPIHAGGYSTHGYTLGLTIADNKAYIADEEEGISILQIIDTPFPQGNLVLCPSGPASSSNPLWKIFQNLSNRLYQIFLDHHYHRNSYLLLFV